MSKAIDNIILQPLNTRGEDNLKAAIENAKELASKGALNIMPNTELNEHINKIVLTETRYLEEIVKALLNEQYVLTLERRDNMTKITWKDRAD